jgi:hypothetical protein
MLRQFEGCSGAALGVGVPIPSERSIVWLSRAFPAFSLAAIPRK